MLLFYLLCERFDTPQWAPAAILPWGLTVVCLVEAFYAFDIFNDSTIQRKGQGVATPCQKTLTLWFCSRFVRKVSVRSVSFLVAEPW